MRSEATRLPRHTWSSCRLSGSNWQGLKSLYIRMALFAMSLERISRKRLRVSSLDLPVVGCNWSRLWADLVVRGYVATAIVVEHWSTEVGNAVHIRCLDFIVSLCDSFRSSLGTAFHGYQLLSTYEVHLNHGYRVLMGRRRTLSA